MSVGCVESGGGDVAVGSGGGEDSYGAAVCAERTAIFKAVSNGVKDFEAIARSSSLDDFAYPCGICRQVMAEFAPDLKIIVTDKSGDIKVTNLSEMLPNAFSLDK